MKILSLFDGIGAARQALKELDIDCEYYASEIDPYAIQIAKANHPDIHHIGDVKAIAEFGFYWKTGMSRDYPISLLVAGFPCQSFSIAGNRKGFEDERGNLFFEALRILKEVKPKYFLFENVFSMSKENKKFIDDKLGVGHVMINSALLTAQNRKRIYWVGKLVNGKYEKVDIPQPYDKGVQLKDIIENGFVDREKSLTIMARYWGTAETPNQIRRYLTMGMGQIVFTNKEFTKIRRLIIKEICRLQGFPDSYADMVSTTRAYQALGNSFTVPVIKHILTNIINHVKSC